MDTDWKYQNIVLLIYVKISNDFHLIICGDLNARIAKENYTRNESFCVCDDENYTRNESFCVCDDENVTKNESLCVCGDENYTRK